MCSTSGFGWALLRVPSGLDGGSKEGVQPQACWESWCLKVIEWCSGAPPQAQRPLLESLSLPWTSCTGRR